MNPVSIQSSCEKRWPPRNTRIGHTFRRPDITLMDLRLPGTNGTDESDLIRDGKLLL
jgi:hypothetical protein